MQVLLSIISKFILMYLQEPMEKLKRISPHSLDGDAGWHLRDIFADTVKDFDKYEEKTVREWQNQLHAELRDRLKQPLLVSHGIFIEKLLFFF